MVGMGDRQRPGCRRRVGDSGTGPMPPPGLSSGQPGAATTVCPMKRPEQLHFTESDDANRLLATDDLAVLIGMLLDQQFPMERAFLGPQLLKERLGEDLDAARINRTDLSRLEEVFKGPPAIHRYPASMAKRTQDMCQVIVDEYDGDASRIWATAGNGKELLKRLKALPGFGEGKSRIFVGLLGKRLGIRPEGWEEAAADWPSIADVSTFDDVLELREQKRQMKQKKKESSG
jgi:uncharacterized HhH-GPD family protein